MDRAGKVQSELDPARRLAPCHSREQSPAQHRGKDGAGSGKGQALSRDVNVAGAG